jgi:hypothetical protein
MSLRSLIVVVLVWVGLAGSTLAQLDTGTITGRVTDPSGSVIPSVRILRYRWLRSSPRDSAVRVMCH